MKRRADKGKKVKAQKWSLGKQRNSTPGPPCFVCGEEIPGRGISLLVGYTTHSKTGLPTKIGQLMGDGFMVVVNTEDMLCRRCTLLLNQLDKLEVDLDIVKTSLMNYLKMKYQLSDENDNTFGMTLEDPISSDENMDAMDKIKTEVLDASSNLSSHLSHDNKDDGSGSEWDGEETTKKVNVEIILDENHSQRKNMMNMSPETLKLYTFECDKCGFGTNNVSEIEVHPSICLNYSHECRLCGKKFDTNKSVQDHIMEAHLSKWTCHFCNTNFSEEREFTDHMRVHIGNRNEEDCDLKNSNGNYECNICDFQCDNKIEYDDHLRKHIILKLFKCKECGKRFGDENSLNEHSKIHECVVKCHVCSLSCYGESALAEHLKCHSTELNLRSGDVMVWANKEHLLPNDRLDMEKSGGNNSEEDSQKGDSIKFQSCAICSVTFLNVSMYEQHMKTHSGVELPSSSKDDIMDADNSLLSSLVDTQNYVGSVIDGSLDDMFEKMHSPSDTCENKPMANFVPCASENCKNVFRCDLTTGDILKVGNESSQGHESRCAEGELCLVETNIKKFVSANTFKCSETTALTSLDSKSIITVDSFSVDKVNLMLTKPAKDSDITKSMTCEEEYSKKSISFDSLYPLPQEKKSSESTDIEHMTDNSFHGVSNRNTQELVMFSGITEDQDGVNVSTIMDEYSGVQKSYHCSECGYRYSEIADFKQHLKEHRSSNAYKCSLCNKSFLSKLRFKRHVKAHGNLGGGKMTCPTCYVEFPDYLHLFQHMQDKHQREKVVYNCEFCNEKFTSKKLFKAHEEVHSVRYELKCDECNLSFTKQRQLKDHKDAAHRDPHCRFCGKEILKLKTLRNHELRHLRDKDNFECDVCKRIFKTKTGLRHHVAVHTGEYKYCCDYCGRGFMSRMMMEEHRSMHTKEERYVCDVCGRKFSFQSTYWIHRKWHDNPYPYKCSFCNRMFRHSSLLAVHKRKHTGERPYQCPHCPLSFPVGGTLKRHLILHTGVYPYNCESCKRGFTTRHKYATHLAKVHGDYDLLNAKQTQGEYKMVIRDEPVQNEDLSLWKLPDEQDPSELNFKLEVAAAAAGDSMDPMETGIPCSVVSDDLLVDSGIAARVVEIVLDDESQAVATVTLAEPNSNILPELWYQ